MLWETEDQYIENMGPSSCQDQELQRFMRHVKPWVALLAVGLMGMWQLVGKALGQCVGAQCVGAQCVRAQKGNCFRVFHCN